MRIRFTVLGHRGGRPGPRAEVTGSLVDVTEGGVGLLTSFPVEQGQVMRFQSFAPEHAIVVWTSSILGRSRAGLKFLHPAEVAERFGQSPRLALVMP